MKTPTTKYYTHKDQPRGFGYVEGRPGSAFLVGKGRNWFFQYKKDRLLASRGDKSFYQSEVDKGNWIQVKKSILN